MRIISYILIAALFFLGGSLYGYYRHITWVLDETTMQGYLKIAENARLEKGEVKKHVELNDIEIVGAVGRLADREVKGLWYVIAGPDGEYLFPHLSAFLFHQDDSYKDSVARSRQSLIDYYKQKPLDYSSFWNCDDLTTDNGRFNCSLYNESKERAGRVRQIIEY